MPWTPKQSRTLKEIMWLSETTEPMLKALRRREQLALAFGQRHAYGSMRYLDVDAVALLLNQALAQKFKRDMAAHLTRIHFGTWGKAVATAEAHRDQPAFFYVIQFLNEHGKAAPLTAAVNLDDQAAVIRQVEASPQAKGHTYVKHDVVDIQRLIRFIRLKGERLGLDQDMAFMPPPGSPEYKALVAPFEDLVAKAIDNVRTMKGKEALVTKVGEQTRRLAMAHAA